MSEPIIVSAFIDLKRDKNVKSLADYLHHSKGLLSTEQKKVVFLEQHVIDQLPISPVNCTIVPFEKSELNYDFSNVVLPLLRNEDKDTAEYLAIQLNKTFWVLRASEIVSAEHFVWVDFAYNHVCRNPDWDRLKKPYDKIRIPGCIKPSQFYNIGLAMPNWYFCGGLFGGSIEEIKRFHNRILKHTSDLLKENKISWEVNIWAIVYRDMPDLFSWFYADHGCEMINNY